MSRTLRFTLASSLLIAAVPACMDAPPNTPIPSTGVSVEIDSSTSSGVDSCAIFGADLDSVLHRPGVSRVDVTLVAVGDQTSADEPVVLVSGATYKPATGAFAKPGALEQYRFEFVARMVTECDRKLVTPNTSPVYVAVKRAAESLNAMCERLSHGNVQCKDRLLFLHSDFRENHQAAIYYRLQHGKQKSKSPALPHIDVTGMEVAACGIASTRQDPKEPIISADNVQAAWSEVLGIDLHIEAGCRALARADIAERAL